MPTELQHGVPDHYRARARAVAQMSTRDTRIFSAHAIVYIIETTYISTGRRRSSVQLNLERQVSDVLDTIRRRREADIGGHGAAATGVSDHPSIMHGWRRGRPSLYVPAHLPARGHGLTLVERGSIGRK